MPDFTPMRTLSLRKAVVLSGFALAARLCIAADAAAPEPRPNILFILTDDMRDDELGYTGHPVVKTPRLDELAQQGVIFQNTFAATPICMVSRASILTGLTQETSGYFAHTRKISAADEQTAFPYLLKDAGYRTGFFGKNHAYFQSGDRKAFGRMFDSWKHIHRDPYFKKQPDGSLRHADDLIADEGVQFLKEQSPAKPFFLYLSFNIAHGEDKDLAPGKGHFPWPPSADGLYEDIVPAPARFSEPEYFQALPQFLQNSLNRKRWFWTWDTKEKYDTNMRARYRMITGLDNAIGRVLDTLKEKGLTENTVIIFSSDNGLFLGEKGLSGKWTHHDESMRIPLFIYDPRGLATPQIREEIALNLDFPSTFLDFAGVVPPARYQGHSLVPLLVAGDAPADWRTDFFGQHAAWKSASIPGWKGVRSKNTVYARYPEGGEAGEFLFDLRTDPDELNNLARDPAHTELLARMRARTAEYEKTYAAAAIKPVKPNKDANRQKKQNAEPEAEPKVAPKAQPKPEPQPVED